MSDWLDLIWYGDRGGSLIGPEAVLFGLLLAFVLGHLIGWVYMWTHTGLSYSQTFVSSLVVMPVLVALMMMLMSGSIVVAFGLLAVFAVVRFRNVLKDTRDTTFILWSIVQGMAVGTLHYTTAVLGTFGVGMVLLYLRISGFGSRHRYDAVLSVQIIDDLASGLADLKQILGRHASRVYLTNERRLTDQGLDLSYRLQLRDPSRSDELRLEVLTGGNFENVSLFLREEESEV